MLPKLGGPSVNYVVNKVMKERTRKGIGKVNHCTPITNGMEDKMWKDGVLGEDNPEKLVETILFLIGINIRDYIGQGVHHR